MNGSRRPPTFGIVPFPRNDIKYFFTPLDISNADYSFEKFVSIFSIVYYKKFHCLFYHQSIVF